MEQGLKKCDATTIQESGLQAINRALGNRDSMMAALQENVEAVIRREDESLVEGIEAKVGGVAKRTAEAVKF